MSTVPEIKLAVRRALEAQLVTAAAAGTPVVPIEYPDMDPGPGAGRGVWTRFFRPSVHYGPPSIMTIGPTPRITMAGRFDIGVFTRSGMSLDASDELAALIGPAFPYDANLAFEGVSVNISTLEARDAATVDSWTFCPVIVNWNVWRV